MNHPIDTHVGRQIRAFRIRKQLSQTDLATELKISFQQIQKYETGHNRVSASKLALIAAKLDVPISAFFPECFQDRDLTTDERSLLANFRSAKPEARVSLISIASQIAEVQHA